MLEPPRPTNTLPNKEIALLLGDALTQIEIQAGQILTLQDQFNQAAGTDTVPTVTPQAVNLLFNGTFSHSTGSWADNSTADDRRYECQSWFSHPTLDGQPMYPNTTQTGGNATVTFTDTDIGTTPSNEITIPNHGLYTGVAVLFTRSAPPSPTPLVDGTVYYVIYVDENTIQLAATAEDAIAGTEIVLTTTGGPVTYTLAFNYTLKTPDHTLYSEALSDWSWTNPSAGCARFQGSYSIDAQLPGNSIEPGYTYYGVFNIVKYNQYIACASEERLWCGLYANQSSTWDWIKGDFEISYDVLDAGVAGPFATTRSYRILATTDRGFTIRSSVLIMTDAPSDAQFSLGARVYLSWKNVLRYGVQTYQIYRETAGTYVLLQTITTGLTSTLDNGSIEDTAVGWPSADFDQLVAYTATIVNVIDELPYSGDPLNPQWATIPFSLKVPQTYDMSSTDLTDWQWLRWGFSSLTGNLDLDIPDGEITDTSTTITTAGSGQFTADMVGLDIDVYISSDSFIGTTIATYVNANEITVADPMTDTGTDKRLYIHEGAPPHSLFIDLAHLTWQLGAAFSPNAADNDGTHGIPPVTPNGTTQGGGGTGQGGGGIDGQPVCLYEEESVETRDGYVLAKELKVGMQVPSGYGTWNTINEVSMGIGEVWYIETENGCTLKCTDTKQIFVSKQKKKPLSKLRKGDKILTKVNGVIQPSPITLKLSMVKKDVVVQIGLRPNEKFLAGGGTGQIVVSNRKPFEVITPV